MSALDFGGGAGANGFSRRYSAAFPELPDGAWALITVKRSVVAPATGQYPTLVQTDDGVQGTTGGVMVQEYGDGVDGSDSIQVQAVGGSLMGLGASNVYDGRTVWNVLQRNPVSGNLEWFRVAAGETVGAPTDSTAWSGTTIAADVWSFGWDWRHSLGEIAFLSGSYLTPAQVTELATGKQIGELTGITPFIHLPLRDGAVDPEPNLGSGGSTYDAARGGTGFTETTEFFALGPPPQQLAPDADVTNGAWAPSTGSDLHACVDESPASDADYISVTSNSECELSLADGDAPDTGDQTLTYRAAGSPAKALVVGLYQTSTLIEQWTTDPLQAAVTEYVRTLSTPLSDLTGLSVKIKTQDAASPPTLDVTIEQVGTSASGTTACTPSMPVTEIDASRDYFVCIATGRSNTADTAFAFPAGWTSLGQLEGGTGTWGVDTGTRRVGAAIKDTTTGSESGTISVTLAGTSANTLRATVIRVRVPAGYTLATQWASGADTSNGTGYSAAASGSIDFASGDRLVVAVAQNIDTGTQSSQSIAAAGITFGSLTNQRSNAVTNGNDHRHVIETVPVTAGTGTVAPTYSYTISANGSGPTGFLRLRAVPPSEAARLTSLVFEAPQGTPGVALAGAAAAQASAAAALAIAKALAGAAVADAAATAAISKAVALAASAAAQAAAGAQLAIAVPLAGAAAGQALGSGQLTKTVWLAGAAVGQADADGEISHVVPLAGSGAGAAAASGALSIGVQLLGAAIAQAAADAALIVSGSLQGAAVAVAGASGALSLSVGLAGAALAQASAAGSIEVAVRLAGAAATAANASGVLFLSVPLQGAAAAVAQAGGVLALTVRLDAAARAVAAASGAVAVQVQLAGDAGAIAQAVADLTVFPAGFEAARPLLARPEPRAWRAAARQRRRWGARPAPRTFTASARSTTR